MDRKMQYESNDHQNPSPGMDHIPGGAVEEKQCLR
jgi:hypothetical protein